MRFNRLDLNLLVALDALLTERSVTRAAERLSLSPSATSDALGRLRAYFEDELLVTVGRRMEPTPRAEALQHAVRDVLVRVDSAIATPPAFDAARSDRVFRILVSDYTQVVLGPHLMAEVAAEGARVRLDFLPQVVNPQVNLERGEADLLVLPLAMMETLHPREVLYEDSFVCLLWQHAPLAQEAALSRARYEAAAHVVMMPQASTGESFQDGVLKRLGIERRVAATSAGFATVAPLLVGTPHVATLHARLAARMLRLWPLVQRPCPLPIPAMQQAMQWHEYRSADPGIVWLRSVFRRAVRRMDETVAADEAADQPAEAAAPAAAADRGQPTALAGRAPVATPRPRRAAAPAPRR